MSVESFIAGLGLADTLLDKVLSKKGTRIEKKQSAVTLMRRAVNNTEVYLEQNNYKYAPNQELSNYWNDAFAAMLSFDKVLARRLDNKSRFWSNPHRWLAEESAMEGIPTLEEQNEKCDLILIELEKRK